VLERYCITWITLWAVQVTVWNDGIFLDKKERFSNVMWYTAAVLNSFEFSVFNPLLYEMCVCVFLCVVCHCLIQRCAGVHGYKFNFVCLIKTTIMWSWIFCNFAAAAVICTICPRMSATIMRCHGSAFRRCYCAAGPHKDAIRMVKIVALLASQMFYCFTLHRGPSQPAQSACFKEGNSSIPLTCVKIEWLDEYGEYRETGGGM
jgi:hypothetical protein